MFLKSLTKFEGCGVVKLWVYLDDSIVYVRKTMPFQCAIVIIRFLILEFNYHIYFDRKLDKLEKKESESKVEKKKHKKSKRKKKRETSDSETDEDAHRRKHKRKKSR